MEKENPITHIRHADIAPPPESNASIVMNGVGNGMLLGTGPFMAMELFSQIREKPLDKVFYKGCAFATVVGCAVGAIYGIHEAKKLNKYRREIGEEINDLRARNQVLEAKAERWADKHAERAQNKEPAHSL